MADSAKGKITLFGSIHIDRFSKVKEELSIVAEESDVIFEESAYPKSDLRDNLQCVLRNPAARFAIICLDIFWTVVGFPVTRSFTSIDGAAINHVSKENEIPVKPVDENVIKPLSRVSGVVSIVSWVWFSFTISLLLLGVMEVSSSLAVGSTLLLSGYVLGFAGIVPVITSTFDSRNSGMIENSRMWFDEEGYESACVVVGNGHIEDIEEMYSEAGFEVVDVYKSKFLRRNQEIRRQNNPPPPKSPPSSR